MFSCYLILILLLRFEPIHYCSPYLLWSTGFCRYKGCLHQVGWVVFIVRSRLTAYSFAKAQLFRFKLFHARHFPQAVFHPLIFTPLCLFVLKRSQKSQLFLRTRWGNDTAALWLSSRISVMGLFLEGLNALIWNLGAELWLEDQSARYPPKWQLLSWLVWLQAGNLNWYWDAFCETFRSHSPCHERTFCPKKSHPAQTQIYTGLIVKQGVGDHYTCVSFFPLSRSTPQTVESAGQIQANLRVGGKVGFRNSFKSL